MRERERERESCIQDTIQDTLLVIRSWVIYPSPAWQHEAALLLSSASASASKSLGPNNRFSLRFSVGSCRSLLILSSASASASATER